MGHPATLLELVRQKVGESYPQQAGYSFTFEETLMHGGRRFVPDIVVRDQRGNIVCLVEIGYTRPEKLTHYRSVMRVQDVRWYDKGAQLHGDVQHRQLVTTHRVQYSVPKGMIFRAVPDKSILCRKCYDEAFNDLDEHEQRDDEAQDWAEQEAANVDAYMLFTPSRWLLVYGCDACGGYSHYSDVNELIDMGSEFYDATPEDVLASWAAHTRRDRSRGNLMLHIDACKWEYDPLTEYLNACGIAINYGDFKSYCRHHSRICDCDDWREHNGPNHQKA